MRLIDDWRRVIKRAWSVRLAALGGVLCFAVAIWPSLIDRMPLPIFLTLGGLLFCAVAIARATKQKGFDL